MKRFTHGALAIALLGLIFLWRFRWFFLIGGISFSLYRDLHGFMGRLDTGVNGRQGLINEGRAIGQKTFATLSNIDKASSTWAASEKQIAGQMTDLATDVHGSISELDLTLASIRPVAGSAVKTLDAATGEINDLRGTTMAATGALGDFRGTIGRLNTSVDATKPLIDNYAAAGLTLNEILKRKAVGEIMDHTAATMGHLDNMSANADKVTTKLTNDFVSPKPWYEKLGPTIQDLWYWASIHAPAPW